MLQKVAIKVSLTEPKKKFISMMTFLQGFGTTEVHLIHVTNKKSMQEWKIAESELERIRSEISDFGFYVYIHIRYGHFPTQIIQEAESQMVDYIALHWMPKSLFRNALLGNIDADILRLSNLPVFIHNPRRFKSPVELERVMYATNFGYTDAAVLPYLVDKRFQAHKLFLLHVRERAPDPFTDAKRRQSVLDNLQRLASECSHAYQEVEVMETLGTARTQIAKQAKARDVHLVVVGRSDTLNGLSHILGSTAEALPHRTSCSVFIIPVVCKLPDPQDKREQAIT